MTKKSLSDLQIYINNNINTNGAQGITGAELNSAMIDTTDSLVHQDFSTLTAPTVATGDLLAINDIDDSNNLKKTTVGDILGLAPSQPYGTTQPTDGNVYNIRATNPGSIAGLARGENSVDLQTIRSSSSERAQGQKSVIVGGQSNQVVPNLGVIVGGYKSRIYSFGTYGFIGGGSQNSIGLTANSAKSAIVNGSSNDIFRGVYNMICNGQYCSIGISAVTNQSFIGSGRNNDIRGGNYNSITSGRLNQIYQGSYNSILGGRINKINYSNTGLYNGIMCAGNSKIYAGNGNVIGGGWGNSINFFTNYVSYDDFNVICGGNTNGIEGGKYNILVGGRLNDVSSFGSTIYSICIGGNSNKSNGTAFNTVINGEDNEIGFGSYNSILTAHESLIDLNHLVSTSISFTAPDTLTTGGEAFTNFFKPGMRLKLTGSTSNDGFYTVDTVTASTLTTIEQTVTTEASGDNIYIRTFSTYTGTDVSFTNPSTITKASGWTDLLDVYRYCLITVSGSTSNDGSYIITSISGNNATVIPVRNTSAVTTESSGDTVTIDLLSDHNLLASGINNLLSGQLGFIGNGVENFANHSSSVINGYNNVAGGFHGLIGNGINNIVSGSNNFIGNGRGNEIQTGKYNFIGGGKQNKVYVHSLNNYCAYNFIGGGKYNDISGYRNVVCGGYRNDMSPSTVTTWDTSYSFIGSGDENKIRGCAKSAIITGRSRIRDSDYAFIGAGNGCRIYRSDRSAIVTGGYNKIYGGSTGGKYTFIGTGTGNYIGTSASFRSDKTFIGNGTFNKIAQGITSHFAFIGTGTNIKIAQNLLSTYSSVVNGINNTIDGIQSFIGTGSANKIGTASYTGTHSSIVSGNDNQIANLSNSKYCFVGSGKTNKVSGDYGLVGNGWLHYIGNGANGSYSCTILNGYQNKIAQSSTTSFSSILGGRYNSIDVDYATIIGGYTAKAKRYGESARSSGTFGTVSSNIGKAQYGNVIARKETTTNAASELFLDGTSQRLVLDDNSTLAVKGIVVGRRTDVGGDASAHYEFWALIDRDTTAASTVLIASSVTANHEDNTNWNVALSADTTNGSLKIDVTGDTGQTVQWVAYIYYAETVDKT